LLVDLDLPEHFVFDLQQVFWVEELAVLKALVPDALRARIQRTLLAEESSFGLTRIGHCRL
jgi:hypothetical protein